MSRQIARVSMQSRCHRNGQKFGDLKIPVAMKITTQNTGNSMRRRHRWTSPRVLSRGAGCRRTMISDRSPICALSNTRAASSLVRNSSIPGTCHHRPSAAADADALEGGGHPEKKDPLQNRPISVASVLFSNLAYCMRAGAALSKRSPVRVQERDECRAGLRDLASGLRRGKLRNGARLEQML